ARYTLPKQVAPQKAPVFKNEISLNELPMLRSWPLDGGAFITLPQVFTRDPESKDVKRSNMGMYRIQLAGNEYEPNQEVGLHYQIHRGIGIHHQKAISMKKPLKVSIFIGGPPAHAFAAVMPLPESVPEIFFAGMLAGRRWRYALHEDAVISADADFCITGTLVDGVTKPEGPFGDHLGYYSLKHQFPVMRVEHVYHRDGAIWPYTVVGRPPQEDTHFGALVHKIAGPALPSQIPGVSAVNAVDAAGVHPLLLAIGSERYIPYEKLIPREILTQANAILGFGQCSLAKYLWIIDGTGSDAVPDISDIKAFLIYALERIDFARDLHFQTSTTMDTLDYSGTAVNQGSKVVIAAAGAPIRELITKLPKDLSLPKGLNNPKWVLPGVVAVNAPPHNDSEKSIAWLKGVSEFSDWLKGIALVVLVDDSNFVSESLDNFIWVSFTRSNPSHDCHGNQAHISNKHWACDAPLIIDARIKKHHAPILEEDPKVTQRIDALCESNSVLRSVLKVQKD
ncbi:MAG: 4-hydroxy-3-polyprenylbenzoate decarboxylase, partial [Candidatus Omnitrophota bacterium]